MQTRVTITIIVLTHSEDLPEIMESLDMVVSYIRSVTFKDSLKVLKGTVGLTNMNY